METIIIISVPVIAAAWVAGRKTGYTKGRNEGFVIGYQAGLDAAKRIFNHVPLTDKPKKKRKESEEPAWMG